MVCGVLVTYETIHQWCFQTGIDTWSGTKVKSSGDDRNQCWHKARDYRQRSRLRGFHSPPQRGDKVCHDLVMLSGEDDVHLTDGVADRLSTLGCGAPRTVSWSRS